MRPRHPAFMSWGIPTEPTTLRVWQDGRCAMCDDAHSQLVEDHCHDTGKVRGMLCRGCNATEPNSDAPAWSMWRAGMTPARLLGEDRTYVSPFTGRPVVARRDLTRGELDGMRDAVNAIA